MKTKIVLTFIACLGLMTLEATSANSQYTSRSGLQSTAQPGVAGNPSGLGLAFVTNLSGESLLRGAADEEWAALSTNLSLQTGDRVWAQEGANIEVRFPMGATAWVNYQSELGITRLESGTRGDTIQLALTSGEAAFDVNGFARSGSVFQVDLPDASIRASRAARFRVNTLPDGTAQIGVLSGSIVLETPDGITDVSAGHMAEMQPDRRIVLDFLPANDEWDDWVGSRAELYDRPAASVRYLPADLRSYAHEFDRSGRWVTDRTYGSVWVPAVEQGWSPYSNGRWVFQANDYIWLAYDPWYAPFHFGRWSWGASIGWYWIAPRGRAYWSPGYVGWSVVGDEVSWVPLGHNEVYYGYGNYGPGSVNVHISTTINVTNVYINSRVNNGVVVVRRDNFLRGKIAHERIVPLRNPFDARNSGGVKILGRPPVPEIKPIRETRLPRPEVEIRRTSLPPAQLDKTSRTIQERVVAPTKNNSAFIKGGAPKPLVNIQKEKELEHWVAPKAVPAPKSTTPPPPAVHQQRTQPPVKSAPQPAPTNVKSAPQPAPATVKSAPKPAPAPATPPPAGKHQFKRVPEPQKGAPEAPAPASVPAGRPKGNPEKQSTDDGSPKGGDREDGKKN